MNAKDRAELNRLTKRILHQQPVTRREVTRAFELRRAADAERRTNLGAPLIQPKGSDMNQYCQRCGEELRDGGIAWLELNCKTGRYTDGFVSEADTQGFFPFGRRCAKTVLRAGGELSPIRAALR